MSQELEDVIMFDPQARKICNFSDIVPNPLKETEITDNASSLLKSGQISLGVEYYTDDEEKLVITRISQDGGSIDTPSTPYISKLLFLPSHNISNLPQNN